LEQSLTVPFQDRFRLRDKQAFLPFRPPAAQEDPNKAIRDTKFGTAAPRSLEDHDLVVQGNGFQSEIKAFSPPCPHLAEPPCQRLRHFKCPSFQRNFNTKGTDKVLRRDTQVRFKSFQALKFCTFAFDALSLLITRFCSFDYASRPI